MTINKDKIIAGLKAIGGALASAGTAIAGIQQVSGFSPKVGAWIGGIGLAIHGASTAVNETLKLLGVPSAAPGVTALPATQAPVAAAPEVAPKANV